jgi:hypothetical protein
MGFSRLPVRSSYMPITKNIRGMKRTIATNKFLRRRLMMANLLSKPVFGLGDVMWLPLSKIQEPTSKIQDFLCVLRVLCVKSAFTASKRNVLPPRLELLSVFSVFSVVKKAAFTVTVLSPCSAFLRLSPCLRGE